MIGKERGLNVVPDVTDCVPAHSHRGEREGKKTIPDLF